MREVPLPSGATLKVAPAPFATAKALNQAVLKELKGIPFKGGEGDATEFLKELFCAGFSSPDIDRCLAECLKRCLYNDTKISADTFEPAESRQDYVSVVLEVTQENIGPFAKSLFAALRQFTVMTPATPK